MGSREKDVMELEGMILLVTSLLFPSVMAGCSVNLDKVNGKYPPLLIENNKFIFPTNEKRVITFEEGGELSLHCHGSSKNANVTFLNKITGLKRGSAVANLICEEGKFKLEESTVKSRVTVEKTSCNRKQEPLIKKTYENCSSKGADSRPDDLGTLARLSIGWQIGASYMEQIGLCIDEKMYSTIWTRHTVHGTSINFRDMDSKRPGFRNDNTGLKRFFKWKKNSSTKMNEIYKKKKQKSTMKKLLGTNNKIKYNN